MNNFIKKLLTGYSPSGYPSHVPEKEGNRYESLKHKKAHKPRHAVFLRVYAVASFLWVAMAGALGLLVFFFVPVSQPAICRPPHLRVGSGLTVQKGTRYV